MFFEFLRAKPCRIIWKLNQQFSFGPEACEIGRKSRHLGYRAVGRAVCGGRRAGASITLVLDLLGPSLDNYFKKRNLHKPSMSRNYQWGRHRWCRQENGCFVKNVTFRIQTAQIEMISGDLGSVYTSPTSSKPKNQASDQHLSRGWCLHQKCYVSGPDGSV